MKFRVFSGFTIFLFTISLIKHVRAAANDIPLIAKLNAPLKAELDISILTTQLKELIGNEVKHAVSVAMEDFAESIVDNKTQSALENLQTFNNLTISNFLQEMEGEKDEKRLLLNSPDVDQDRLNRTENQLATLNNAMQQQSQTIQQQTLTVQQQGTVIQQQGTTIQQQSKTMQLQNTEIKQLQSAKGTGSTYIIWGRKQCPNVTDTEQVYSGYAGGGYYSDYGSASEYVCLPPDPDFQRRSGNDGGHMYGAEYEGNFFGSENEDVPCSVCRKTTSTSILMIPGKNKCYKGWNMEYHGYLGSGYHGYAAASSYVCVATQPEYLNTSLRNDEGKLFYSVLAKCGSLPCPPYHNNYPLTCVVCTKV